MRLPSSICAALAAVGLCGCGGEVAEVEDPHHHVVERGPVFTRDGAEIRHGVWTGWHANGQRSWKVRYVRGTSVGLRREWHENGAKAAEIKLGWDGKPLEERGAIKRWNPDGSAVEPPKIEEKSHG